MKNIIHEKLHRLKKNQRGFTLIELIVSMVVLAVVMAAAMGMMLSTSNFFNRNSLQINLQNASQQALSQMGQEMIDTDAGLWLEDDGKALALVNRETASGVTPRTYAISVYAWDSAEKKLYFRKFQGQSGSADFVTLVNDTLGSTHVVAEDVTDVSYSIPAGTLQQETHKPDPTGAVPNPTPQTYDFATQLHVEITMERRSFSYTGKQTMSLRNRVYKVADMAALDVIMAGK